MISLNSIIFNGIDATRIDVQVQLATGFAKPEFNIIGLADRAVKESAERIRNVLSALNLALPPKRLTVNLSPADLEKSGSHFDLPILCGILCAIGVLPEEKLSQYLILGEVGLNGPVVKYSQHPRKNCLQCKFIAALGKKERIWIDMPRPPGWRSAPVGA